MKCPKCYDEMATLSFGDVQVDRCVSCQGMWFDMGEDEQLRAR